MTISTFTADAVQLLAIINDDGAAAQPTTVDFTLSNGDVVPGVFAGTAGPEHTYIYETDASDGVYTCTVDATLNTEDIVSIVNLEVATLCLLKGVISNQYDCRLMQEIEAVKVWINAKQGELAREVYSEAILRCGSCLEVEPIPLSGISIWYIDDDFIVQ